MSGVRSLSGPPLVEIVDGRRVLARDLVLDMGTKFEELEWWSGENRRDDGPDWVVSRSYEGNTVIRVKEGFGYDGASIPGWAQSFIMGPKEKYELAGCVHDLLYMLQAPRGVADSVFRWIARSGDGVSAIRGFIGWTTLRLVGWAAYRSHGNNMYEKSN